MSYTNLFKLKTKAITSIPNSDKKYLYDVTIDIKPDSRYYPNVPILNIQGTPGKWHINALVNGNNKYGSKKGEIIMIDGGQQWSCDNIYELLQEAFEIMKKRKIVY